jgi:hypothetical protein
MSDMAGVWNWSTGKPFLTPALLWPRQMVPLIPKGLKTICQKPTQEKIPALHSWLHLQGCSEKFLHSIE